MAKIRWVTLKSRKIPVWLRIQLRLAAFFDKNGGETSSPRVNRLPFNQIIKFACYPAELEAMQFIQKHTTIPVPRVTKVYTCGKKQYLVMDAVDGQTLDSAWPDLTEDQRLNIVQEFTAIVQQLRDLVPPEEGAVGSTSLGPGYDHRLGDRHFGPFNNIADFHFHVRRGVPLEFWGESVKQVHDISRSYAIKYSHADICPNNVLVKDGKIVAIVDWEFAGWYPEYWEYTKIHYGWRPYRKEFYDAFEQTMTTYPEELKAESAIWCRYSTFHYDDPITEHFSRRDETDSKKDLAEKSKETPEHQSDTVHNQGRV